MHTNHPRSVNQNFAGPDPISVVGDWLGAALNTTGATFEVAPVFTMMESAVLAKLGRIAGRAEGLRLVTSTGMAGSTFFWPAARSRWRQSRPHQSPSCSSVTSGTRVPLTHLVGPDSTNSQSETEERSLLPISTTTATWMP